MTTRHKLRKLLSKQVVLGDGAMGTMLYQYGVFLNTCFDELNLTKPNLVQGVHDDYVKAGVDFIETNTFGANEFKLGKFGLADKEEQINHTAVELARISAGQEIMVAGSIGPLGRELAPYGRLPQKKAKQAFKRQATALIEGGVDFLILETFSSAVELLTAIHAVREITDIDLIAQITVNEKKETIYGKHLDDAISKISQEQVTAVGMNCSVGPSQMLDGLELISKVTDKPISIQPNAGLPREVEGRTLYMCTPEYLAEYAKRLFEKGAKIIGGCCGTTPEQIAEIVRTIRAIDKATTQRKKIKKKTIKAVPKKTKILKPKPLEKRSKWGKKLVNGKKKVTTIEITPPKGVNTKKIIKKARLCADHGIDAINIPDGPRASSLLSPMVTAVQIQQQAEIETILHVCCRDRNLISMQSDMLGASAIGVNNTLIVTGDPPKLGNYPEATGVFDLDSIAFAAAVNNLNKGIDIGGSSFSPPTKLTIGVGANPVATDLEREIDRFKQKVKAGAEFAITQPVFDTTMLLDFLEAVKDYRIPTIAGIWPFASYKNAEFMANEVPGVIVPENLLKRMSKAKTKKQGRATGVTIAREMIEQINDKVEGFAVSAPFGNVKIALATLGKIDIEEI